MSERYRFEPVTLALRDRVVTVQRKVYEGCDYPTAGPQVAKFTETFFKATKGEFHGQPLKVRPWQQEVFDGIFRLDPVTGRRVVRTAILKAPRKYGKSQVMAPIVLYYLLCVTDSGVPEVYSAAGDRQQAKAVFKEVAMVVQNDKRLLRYLTVYRDRIVVSNPKHPNYMGEYRALSADASLANGLNPLCVIADEAGTWKNRELLDVLTSGGGARRDPLTILISTPGVDKTHFYGELCDRGERIAAGEFEDPSFYYKAFEPEAGEKADWEDPQCWIEAQPGLGDYVDPTYYEDNLSKGESVFRRFFLAQWTQTANSWLRADAWDDCWDPTAVIEDGEDVYLMADGSYDGDSTAILMVTADGRVCIPHSTVAISVEDGLCLWEKPPAGDVSWRVPQAEVEAALADLATRYNVVNMAFDPYRWQRTMEKLADDGLPIVEYPQTASRMVKAASKFEQAVYGREVKHLGQPQLRRHLLNCTVKVSEHGQRPVKKARASKIDAAIAMVCAFDLASAGADAALSKPTPAFVNIWETE